MHNISHIYRCRYSYICKYRQRGFISLMILHTSQEFPNVRYRAAKSSLDVSMLTTLRDLVPTKLAAAVWNYLAKYKATIPDFPQRETCELLIVDRSIDQVLAFHNL